MTSHARSAGALARPVVRTPGKSTRPIGRPPRPILLFIVYGVFLVIVGVTATAQVMLASVHVSTSALNQAVGTDTQVIRGFVDDLLTPGDLTAASDHPGTPGGARGRAHVVHHAARHHPGRDPPAGRHRPREQREPRRLQGPRLGRLADGALRSDRRVAGARRAERGRPGRPRHRHHAARVLPAAAGRARGRRRRRLARRHADHVRDRRREAGRRAGDRDRGDRRRRRPVPRLPLGAGPDHRSDRRPARGDAPRPVHRDAQPRRAGGDHRRGDRAPPRDGRRARDRDPRHRQLPDPQRHLGPRRGRRGDRRRQRPAQAAGADRARRRPLRPRRVPGRGRGPGGGHPRRPRRRPCATRSPR